MPSLFEGAELDCNIAEPLAQVAADMTDSSSTVQMGVTFITPVKGQWNDAA